MKLMSLIKDNCYCFQVIKWCSLVRFKNPTPFDEAWEPAVPSMCSKPYPPGEECPSSSASPKPALGAPVCSYKPLPELQDPKLGVLASAVIFAVCYRLNPVPHASPNFYVEALTPNSQPCCIWTQNQKEVIKAKRSGKHKPVERKVVMNQWNALTQVRSLSHSLVLSLHFAPESNTELSEREILSLDK